MSGKKKSGGKNKAGAIPVKTPSRKIRKVTVVGKTHIAKPVLRTL